MKKIFPLQNFKNQSQEKSQKKKHNISNKIIVLFSNPANLCLNKNILNNYDTQMSQ